MPADFSPYKVKTGDGNASTIFNNFVQACEDALNAVGDAAKTGFASGLIFDPGQIRQGGATTGQWLAWSGAAWAGATPPSSTITTIADTTLAANAASFDFQSISGSYKHLYLTGYLRSDRAAVDEDLGVRFNNDSAGNYDGYTFQASGTAPSVQGNEALAATSAKMGNGARGNSAPLNVFSTFELWIPHYAGGVNNKTFHGVFSEKRDVTTGNLRMLAGVGAWRSSSAVTRVTLLPVGGGSNWVTGSRATLYGVN
jgi:hypothetical protein